MRHRLLTVAGFSGVAIAAAWLASGSLAAQVPAAATKRGTLARTVDGRPDLQGIYNVATITPLERLTGFGGGLVLTSEQATALDKDERQRNQRSTEPSRPDREAPPVGGDKSTPRSYLEGLFAAGGGVVGGYKNFWPAAGTQVITVDGQKRSSLIVDPPDGKVPPLKPEARKRNAAFLARAVSPDAAESAAAGPA